MASLMFASCLTCLLVWNKALATDPKVSIRQDGGLILADAGGTVTLRCFYECNTRAVFHWYKQTLGQKPNLISTFFVSDTTGTFQGDFKNNSRFLLETKNGIYHITISDLCISDSATYFCASMFKYNFEFAEGVTVSVKGSDSNVPALVHQSVFGSIQPGGSVTLNCLVQTGTCDGQHSVYWFKDSGEARPGIIYTHRDRNDQCERKPDTRTHTCVYNLPLESLNASHTGTYYCAVASCGHILFGNGTKLDLRYVDESFMLVCVLSGASVFTTLLVVFLAYPAYRTYKANGCQCTDFKERSQPSSAPNAEVYEDAENLNYGAMKRNQMSRSARQRGDTWSECVYSHVRM
ncbi:uncharacterized protein LOC129603414 isoform X2 [Betta splendens]|uniref:Uncharacterized protein LOC129603414 isoform X2 n=1 Tax=Betta splendens TaxID=158456 RepID=A0A9W2XER2_BETSP|nr:uncharacterized protein LOC129603414 isoform X2 [Betta splendens]